MHRVRNVRFIASLLIVLIVLIVPRATSADVTRRVRLTPGTPTETAAVLTGLTTTVADETRRAEAGGFWTYRFVATPNARCVLSFTAEGDPTVNVVTSDGKPLLSRMDRSGDRRTVYCTAPANHPFGGGLRFQFAAKTRAIGAKEITLEIRQPDSNGDGVSDAMEAMMGLSAGQRAQVTPRPPRPQTSFQTGSPYSSTIGLPTDAVLAYSDNPGVIQSWLDRAYTVQTMGGFRATDEYAKAHPDEVQTDAAGKQLIIGGNSYYMVPTLARLEIAKTFYRAALIAGSVAVCPEEPELFSRSGYSEAFKKEWKARYGTDWEPPHNSVDTRYKAEQLKAFLTRRQIETVLNDAQQAKPNAARMVAIHSPVTYYQWGIPVPHYSLLSIPALQEIIGQVWTGTARTPARSAGIRAERTFEVGYLEYSSLYHLTRSSGKRMWFLMDPVEDNPNLPMEDYHTNYEQTLLAALLFPQVDSFEVMPWPDRIYGRVPNNYATEINSVVGALCEMWRFPNGQIESGSEGIGTFVSDSMGWQRAEPAPSDYDGFFGLALPLVLHGVPLQVLSLDRVGDAGYLNRTRTLLVSYDFLKPSNPALNRALADWTRRGGSLVLFGGTDAYDAVGDSWWRKAGFASPLDDLFTQLGIKTSRESRVESRESTPAFTSILRGDGAERSMKNRRPFTIDLTPYAQATGSAQVRFEDISPEDGWGPQLISAELRIGGKLAAAFRAGSELETRFLAEERNTRFNGEARFADRDGYWIYRFDNLPRNTPITLTIDIGNGYHVSAASAPTRPPLLETTDTSFDPTVMKLRLRPNYPLTPYTLPPGATPVYTIAGQKSPVVWEAKVGDGSVMFAGIAPGYLSTTAQTSRWLRALTKRAFQKAGGTYAEQSYFLTKRGPYTAVRALGDEYTVDGRWVNLLSPTLAVVEDPVVPAHGAALFQDAGTQKGGPRLLAASGRVGARSERSTTTAFLVQAPAKTDGAARLWTGKRRLAGVRAFTLLGEPVPVSTYPDGDTLLLRYENDPEGVIVRVGWE